MPYRLLIVEDERELIEVYKIALPRYDVKIVDIAMDGMEAIEKYRTLKNEIDLVLMDHRMPILSGLEASREILNFDPGAVIVFGSADVQIRGEAKQIGVKLFKKKPFGIKELVSCFQALLG